MSGEYLIRRTDGEWFSISASRAAEAYRPTSFASERTEGWGDWRIRTNGVEISFSYEDPGIQVTFETDCSSAVESQIIREILENIERVTGQKGHIVPL